MKTLGTFAVVLVVLFQPQSVHSEGAPLYPFDGQTPVLEANNTPPAPISTAKAQKTAENTGKLVRAYVTGYNTVPAQTDSTPCSAPGGSICGRKDVVACPTYLPLHAHVSIAGKVYECMDRTSVANGARFDISCDKDMACPYRITGWYSVRVL